MDTYMFVATFLINLVLTAAICSGPIVLYRFLIRRQPIDKKKAKKISIIYGIIAFIIMAVILTENNSSSSPGASIILWSYVNYHMLISGLEENNVTEIEYYTVEEKKESSYLTYTESETYFTEDDTPKKNRGDRIAIGIGIAFFAIIFVAFITMIALIMYENISKISGTANNEHIDSVTESTSAPALQPVEEPISGYILAGMRETEGSELTVTAPLNASCVVKLKTVDGFNRMSFYVRAGETVTVKVAMKSLYVYFATGETWYGREHLFGSDTSYFKDDELIDFSQYTIEYTLTPITDGNFQQTPIDADEF